MQERCPEYELFEKTVRAWRDREELAGVTALTPDASLRRYFRLHLKSGETVVASIFDSVACPEATGDVSVNSFDASVGLGKFLFDHGIPVAQIYYERREPYLLLCEDLGDDQLITVLQRAGSQAVCGVYREAIEVILRMQNIPKQPEHFAYRRSFDRITYRKEIQEFEDYVLSSTAAPGAERSACAAAFDALCAELDEMEKVLTHRDFHSWNLMVDRSGRLRVIDYQDALLATRQYDLVGLLNDRDTDSALGESSYRELVQYFAGLSRLGERFWGEYDRVLLQRDLKVSGRFAKLVKVRGIQSYGRWIPGTLRRIGRTLERLSRKQRSFANLSAVLQLRIPEVAEGLASPLELRPSYPED